MKVYGRCIALKAGIQQAQKMSLAAKIPCAVAILFYFLGFIPGVKENLAMIPA